MSETGLAKRLARKPPALACILLLTACALLMAGCVYSDTITERVYDSDPSSKVDESIPPKLINTVTASIKTDSLPRLDHDEQSQEQEKEEEELPVFDGDTSDAVPQMAAAQAEYNEQAASVGKALDGVSEKSKGKGKTGRKRADKGEDAEATEEGEAEPKEEKQPEEPRETPAPDEGEDEDNDKPREEEGASGSPNQRSSGTGDEFTFEEGEEPVIPEDVNRVAATGNNAIIVSVIAGSAESNVLVACDSETKSKTASLLADKGIANAEAVWSNDGSSAGDLSAEGLKALGEELMPDQIFVTSGSDTLTDEQKSTLKNDYHINVYELPELSSATAIRTAVEIVGKTLDAGGVDNARSNYESYLELHDELVGRYAANGPAGGFDFDRGESVSDESDDTMVTLFVDGWQDAARFKDAHGYLATESGVATATLGYATSPITYYLSMGGVLNNASSRVMRQELKNNSTTYMGAGLLWQFSSQSLPYDFGQWSKLDSKDVYDLSANISGGRFKSNLAWYTPAGEGGFGLGTSHFPAVVARDQRIAGLLAQNSGEAGTAYYPYKDIRPAGKGTTVGYWPSEDEEPDGFFVEACIGAGEGSGTVLPGADEAYGVYTNPKGLVQANADDPLCSWIQGSLESVLEASWAHWMFQGGSQSDFEGDVADFYRSVYGYEVSADDLAAIEAGAAS